MRVYLDIGVFVDYLSLRGAAISQLRSTGRRGRSPANLAADAERFFQAARRRHEIATSALTYYEVEEALYRDLLRSSKGVSQASTLLVPAARSIVMQVDIVVRLFDIAIVDLTAETVRLQLQQIELQQRGVRAADALDAATAIEFGADLLVSTDLDLLELDSRLTNKRGFTMRCCDTDTAIELL